MVGYLHHHHFLLCPLLRLRNLEWEPSFYPSFRHMQMHMALRKLAPLVNPFSANLKRCNFTNHNGRGHYTLVLHVVKNGDDAPISLLW
jgi:hypothetical protein